MHGSHCFVKTASHPNALPWRQRVKASGLFGDLHYFHKVWERARISMAFWHFEGNRHTLTGEISGMISEQKHCHQVSKQ